MAGLLDQAGNQAPEQQEMPPQPEQQDPQQQGGDDFQDPALQRAIAYVGDRLYGEDQVAQEVAQQLGGAEVSLPKIIATIAYTLAQAADEATDGLILEENLSILGMLCLNEIFTVANEAGMPVSDGDISAAMKQMIIMYGKDNGLTEEELNVLSQGMVQVDDAQFAQEALALPDSFGDAIPEDQGDEQGQQMNPMGA